MEITAERLDEKIRLLATRNGDTNAELAEYASHQLERTISREYIRRLAVAPGKAGHIAEEDADADVLAVLALRWDVPLNDLSPIAFVRSRAALAVHGVIARYRGNAQPTLFDQAA